LKTIYCSHKIILGGRYIVKDVTPPVSTLLEQIKRITLKIYLKVSTRKM